MAEEKILVIEDNHMNLALTKDILELQGYSVIDAITAEEGIEMAKSEMPQIILMDISLPGIDGLEATRVLRQDPDLGGIPIVALTAHAMKGDEKNALEAGCNGYITKPINVKTFADQVAEFLNPTTKPYVSSG